MKKYQILDHKADLKIKVFGKTKKELFENAMLAMFKNAGYEPEKNGRTKKRKIKILAVDLPSLLVDFLNELLYLVETKKLVFTKVKFQKFEDRKIEAVLSGKKLKKTGTHIKGATYYELKIFYKNGKWQTVLLFDI